MAHRRHEARKGLLDTDSEPPSLRRSLEEAYRSSSDDEDAINELDPLTDGAALEENVRSLRQRRKRGILPAPNYGRKGVASGENERLRWRIARMLWPARTCMVLMAIVLGSITGAIAIAGTYVYKTSPDDGLSPPWYPTPRGGTVSKWKDSYEKAAKMVSKMSLVEKVNITTGTGWQMGLCVGNTGPAVRAGFPALCLQDGPLGIRFADNITAFPAGITTGATWNRDLMYRRGSAHGLEARLKGVNILLGPAMGPLGRMPAGGRNWEGFGADPVLQGVAAAQTIRGIQDQGVIATAKHYIGNEQEHFRQSFEWGLPNAMSANIDDRTLHELYLWPFAESVRAGVASVMCSYQMVNNSYACGNSKLMNGILKDELGFQGFVQSDWLAQRGGISSALAGLDMDMPGDGLIWADGKSLWGSSLTIATLNGSVPTFRLNDMATRIVASWYQMGQDNTTLFPLPLPEGEGGPNFSSWTRDKIGLFHHGSGEGTKGVVNKFIDVQGKGNDTHGKLAREIAAEGTVLLKNEEHILPLDWTPDLVEGRKLRVGVFGEDAGEGRGKNACPDRGCNQGTLASGWGSGAVDFPYLVTPIWALNATYDLDKVNLTAHLSNDFPPPGFPEEQDICLVFINADSGEGFQTDAGVRGDRNDLYAQKDGDLLVSGVAERCGGGKGKTVVVVHSVGPIVVEKWIDLPGVKGLIFANLPGEESGRALCDILFGAVNPSGKLPYTVGKTLQDYGEGVQVLYFPNGVIPQQDFKEGLYIDYRHFDKYNITPRFEFGFGLSYTTFTFTNLTIIPTKAKSTFPDPRPTEHEPPQYEEAIPPASEAVFPTGFRKLKNYVYPYISSTKDVKYGKYPYPAGYETKQTPSPAGGGEGGNPSLWDIHAEVSLNVSNTGNWEGKEVVQLYLSFPDGVVDPPLSGEATGGGDKIDFPVKVLRAFEKVSIDKGGSTQVNFALTRKDLSYWSVRHQNWVMPTEGKFTIRVGNSSRKLLLEGTL